MSENKPNLEQILTGAGDAPAAGGKGKAAPAKAEAVQLEEGDTDLTDTVENNFLVGDAVEQIIQLNFEARALLKRPKVPHYLNAKLCLVGNQFSGKNTQAERVAKEYGL